MKSRKPSFRDCYAKIDRADECIGNLHSEISRFIESDPYRFVFERHKRTGLNLVCRCDDSAIDPLLVRFAIQAGEIVHHLRSALNHFVHQSSTPNSVTTSTEFPIFRDGKRGRAALKSKIKGITSPLVRKAIASEQPYRRQGLRHPLWTIYELDRIDKHRVIIVTTGSAEFYVKDGAMGTCRPVFLPKRGLKNGAVVAKPASPPVHLEVQAPVQVLLGKIGRIPVEPVIPRLTQCSQYVRGLIGVLELL